MKTNFPDQNLTTMHKQHCDDVGTNLGTNVPKVTKTGTNVPIFIAVPPGAVVLITHNLYVHKVDNTLRIANLEKDRHSCCITACRRGRLQG